MTIFTGSATALVTPFNDDSINFKAFAKHIDFQLSNGTSALVVCGTTGEPSTMTNEEKIEAIKFVVSETNKRVPVIAGTGGNNTKKVIEDSQKAQKLGADALLVVTPYYNKATQKGLVQHYNTIADNVDLPIIVYNVPSRTGVNMKPETLAEISHHKNIVAMKEASGDIRQIQDMVRLCGDNIDMYSGDDFVVLPLLACGGKGVISVVSNIAPKESHLLVQSYMNGDISKARKYQYMLNPLSNALFCEVNPIPVKTAMNLMGMDAGKLRLPLWEMEEKNKEYLIRAMKEFGINI
jgi:4-hydroxy-tetrahydrodipicolinate synthase